MSGFRRLDNRDLWAGLVFVAVGACALALGRDLATGSAADMGEGYVPRAVAVALVALGAFIAAAAWVRGSTPLEPVSWRPLLFVTGAILAFAAALQPLGLLAAVAAAAVTANCAGRPLAWRPLLVLVAALSLGVVALFIWGLGLPLAVLPRTGG
jgi:hypothetical protein